MAMNESIITKISLIITILGMIFIFSYSEEVDLQAVASLDTFEPEEVVTITGEVHNLRSAGNVTFLEISGQKALTMPVIIFAKSSLQEGDLVQVTGIIEEYKGKKEIIASKVKKQAMRKTRYSGQ